MTFKEQLIELDACKGALEWAGDKTFEDVWKTCERGDWMLWLFHRMQDKDGWGDLRNKTAAKVKCVRLVEHLLTDQRSKDALNVAQRFSEGNATREELNSAAAAAYTAANAAYTAAYDAYTAANAAYAAAYAAYDAAYDAYAAAYAAYAAARENILKKCADICRDTLITPLNIHV
jgi:hypothetical protein